MQNFSKKVNEMLKGIETDGGALADELKKVRTNKKFRDQANKLSPKLPIERTGLESAGRNTALETIVLRVGRPVLEIAKDKAVLQFKDAESAVWKSKLQNATSRLTKAIKSIGRIEVQNHPVFEWLGTGWLVDKNVVVTNRHVAKEFGERNGERFIFSAGVGDKVIGASIDFIEEISRKNELTFVVKEILHIEKDSGPDIAFLKVEPIAGTSLPAPIALLNGSLKLRQDIAVIGYPAYDSRIPDQQLMVDIFGDVYDKKRLAPGQIRNITDKELAHDCSTLGGNSGSALIDLATGNAVGLHFAGRFLENNFAVPASVVGRRLKEFGLARTGSGSSGNRPVETASTSDTDTTLQLSAAGANGNGSLIIDISVPLQITVRPGKLKSQTVNSNDYNNDDAGDDSAEDIFTEGRVEDYHGREGYSENFLGNSFKVALPKVSKPALKNDILSIQSNGTTENILKYEHFSVMMSKKRRQCFFSAVNIDGKTSVGMKRGAWRTDPRIPANAQILKECYGNPPKFSRGHMTRREDPIWGNPSIAARGNSDSMHVTNTVPQMQGMNAGIWLSLENYALQNARKDDQKISVLTGPVFLPDDPIRDGVTIPLSFWKIIAFVHDETGKLCATGYMISQKDFISDNEFVFGKHKTDQKKISEIEKLTGLSFGKLKNIDPLNTSEELPSRPLTDLSQIRFF